MAQQEKTVDPIDSAIAEGGAYEVIRKRLTEQGKHLGLETQKLNESRLEEFGFSEMSVIARVRLRTENNCIARDIVQVGELLLFGYNVFIGLKKETKIEDVFSLYSIKMQDQEYVLEQVKLTGTFMEETTFINDFDELYRYYKHARLLQLSVRNGKLLASFQIGERLDDIRVFRWSISSDGKQVKYIDNRGERDIQLPPPYDFEWIEAGRDNVIHGRHSHINILDTIFVETIAGDLTVKVENNTEDGLGIYREAVEDKSQSLDDARFLYAALGGLILLKILPYKETVWRYLVFNTLTQQVLRIDSIGESCVQLPEDHGIIFPGGYYLQTGEYKTFGENVHGLKFKRMVRSPNGEDVLYIFYDPDAGIKALFPYNIINKTLQNPIFGHGYALSEEGKVVIFSAENEPTRVHPMQIWQTPYFSDVFASKAPTRQTFLGKIGNAPLVRGISDIYSICRIIEKQSVSLPLYEELYKQAQKIFDAHFWLGSKEVQAIALLLREIAATADLVIDEYEKVESIRQQSLQKMIEAKTVQEKIVQSIAPDNWHTAEEFVEALSQIRRHRGHLATLKEYRYIDLVLIDELDKQLIDIDGHVSQRTVDFLADEKALHPYHEKIAIVDQEVQKVTTNAQLKPLMESVEKMAMGLDLLSELMSSLKVEDATLRTRIIENITEVYASLNQTKAAAKHQQSSLGLGEATAQFAAQFKLLSQSVANALGLSITPEKSEEQLARLLIRLEELESQFSDHDQFLIEIMQKREEIYEAFESHKQKLLDERQLKTQKVFEAAQRTLGSIQKRTLGFTDEDSLNTYLASDPLVLKTRELVDKLRSLDDAIKADDIEAKFKAIKEQGIRSLRDKVDIYEDEGSVIKLGPRHKFSVNKQDLDLTIIPRDQKLHFHLTGTDYFELIDNPEFLSLKDYWEMALESETSQVYRSEYLASLIIDAAYKEQVLAINDLHLAIKDQDAMLKIVRDFAGPRYKEGYEKGVHDHDTALILAAVLPVYASADLLRFDPESRALAQVFFAYLLNYDVLISESQITRPGYKTWANRAQSALQLQQFFLSSHAVELLATDISIAINEFVAKQHLDFTPLTVNRAAYYLVAELGRERTEFITTKYAQNIVAELKHSLPDEDLRKFNDSLQKLQAWPLECWNMVKAWLAAIIAKKQLSHLQHYLPEAVVLVITEGKLSRRMTEVDVEIHVENLMGDHVRISNRTLHFSLDDFLLRVERHKSEVLPSYYLYLSTKQAIIEKERKNLRLHEFKAKPLSSFVRNRLINESYLPLIGDNLAKQMGTVGENKRTDLMGLLMMISPPGYGKTTLMEYVANRLGLIFMKINCPSLGHQVLSLDPQQAPNATARQELNKLNLALEMGNNVMLYLDDIQHTHSEFLQKFISLCDGTRRIEGVWKGETKTYDMRGRKFCVVMAGNPYTESGEAFKVPDMLANRADIYNLGDILGGMEEQFSLSYIENCLTSNPVTAPLALRHMDDVYKLVDMAKGKAVATTELKHQYSAAEINEITNVLKKLFRIQEVVLKINQQYIASAAQDDKYRTEPTFKLQGSYRNMNKMAEKISAVMNEQELMQMISDHYLGESQLLTTGAEANLLKLAELRGNATEAQIKRWQQIKQDFLRNKSIGGDDTNVGNKVVAQLVDLVGSVRSLALPEEHETVEKTGLQELSLSATTLRHIAKILTDNPSVVQVVNEPVPGINALLGALVNTLENSIYPVIRSMDKKIDIDLKTHDKMQEVMTALKKLQVNTENTMSQKVTVSTKPVAVEKQTASNKNAQKTKDD